MKNKLIIFTLIILSLFVLAGNGWSGVNLPYVKFAGAVQTTPGIGTGALTVQTIVITQLFYIGSNGVPTNFNTPGVESIIGKPMTITGATRTGNYTFADATIAIGDVANTYFTATLSNIEFVQVGNEWALNPLLDSTDPSTMNISNITFPGNRTVYPSRYIDELEQELLAASTDVSGLKMRLKFVFPAGSDITGFGIANISEGILDGSPAPTNTPPQADAGATSHDVTCLATSCDITLDGSQSTDADSTVGTNDDIEFFEWYDGTGALIATGETAVVTLPLGMHDITLRVIDFAGVSSEDIITIVIDPAELSFIEIDKAHVKRDGKVKIRGRLALPAGVSHLNVNSVGRGIVGISSLGNVIDESVDFTENSNANRWRYNVNTALGINKFRIDWNGSKFKYTNGPLSIKTQHIGDNETELEISSCLPVTIDINGTIVTIDANDNVSCSNASAKVDGDDDGDSDDDDSDGGNSVDDDGDDCTVGVRLPFDLTPDMVINITGSVNASVLVGDYYTAAVGKFKLHGRFDATGIDLSALTPKSLTLTIALGDEGFSGTLVIDEATWTKIKTKYWKFKLK